MRANTFWDRVWSAISWIAFSPVLLAFRIIWLWAKIGNQSAQDVYRAMWLMNLDLPPIPSLIAELEPVADEFEA